MLENLKKLRAEHNISQQKLADAISISQQSINKYENHNVQPDIETLKKLADYFDTSIDYIVGYSLIRNRIASLQISELTEDEAMMLSLYRKVSDREKHGILAMLKVLTGKGK